MESLNLPFFCPQASWVGNVTGTSLSFDVGEYKRICAVLDVEFLGGATGALLCSIEASLDREYWYPVAGFSVVNLWDVPFHQVLAFSPKLRYVRATAALNTSPTNDTNPCQAFFTIKGIATV